MDLEKKYYTIEGVECNILQLIKMEPEWAANRIQVGEKALAMVGGDKGVESARMPCSTGDVENGKGGLSAELGDKLMDKIEQLFNEIHDREHRYFRHEFNMQGYERLQKECIEKIKKVFQSASNKLLASGEDMGRGGPQNHKEWISPLLMGLIADEYGRKGDREAARTCVEIMRRMKW